MDDEDLQRQVNSSEDISKYGSVRIKSSSAALPIKEQPEEEEK